MKEEAASRMGFVQIGAAGHQGIEEAVGITGVGGITVATALVRLGVLGLVGICAVLFPVDFAGERDISLKERNAQRKELRESL